MLLPVQSTAFKDGLKSSVYSLMASAHPWTCRMYTPIIATLDAISVPVSYAAAIVESVALTLIHLVGTLLKLEGCSMSLAGCALLHIFMWTFSLVLSPFEGAAYGIITLFFMTLFPKSFAKEVATRSKVMQRLHTDLKTEEELYEMRGNFDEKYDQKLIEIQQEM